MDNKQLNHFKIVNNQKIASNLKNFNDAFLLKPGNENKIKVYDSFTNENIVQNLIHGYIQMGHLNQEICHECVSCEVDADKRLKKYLDHSN